MKNLVVGQEVLLFGIGFLDGKVVSVSPTIDVQTADVYPAFFQFDQDGKETEASRCRRLGVAEGEYRPGPEWEPWEIVATTPEEIIARRRAHDLVNLEALISNVLAQLETGHVEFAKTHAKLALEIVNQMRHCP
jgi:hypothetical protein